MTWAANPALPGLRRASLGVLATAGIPALGCTLVSLALYLLDDDRSPATVESVLQLSGMAAFIVVAYGWPYMLGGLFTLTMLHAFRRSGPVSAAVVGALTTTAPIALGLLTHRASFVAEVTAAAVAFGALTGLAVWALTFRRPR